MPAPQPATCASDSRTTSSIPPRANADLVVRSLRPPPSSIQVVQGRASAREVALRADLVGQHKIQAAYELIRGAFILGADLIRMGRFSASLTGQLEVDNVTSRTAYPIIDATNPQEAPVPRGRFQHQEPPQGTPGATNARAE